ncbi:MAG: tetratricopeptide repeat protein [Spirochaetaceae bacterium]|jgi:tetratricopeptide (TPR) repeat protein|nr:tetratricopeptide repeat protein [Spirochaetaceae bacterium]
MNNENVSLFFQRRRALIAGTLVIAGVTVLAALAFFFVQDIVNKKAIQELEALVTRYDELKPSFAAGEDDEKRAGVDELLTAIRTFAEKNTGYSAARAWSMAAGIYADRKGWQEAESAYLNSAVKGKKTYLAPVSYYNAAVCAEEQANTEIARAHLVKSLGYTDFPLAARAQFAIARLLEQEGDTAAALEAYRLVTEKYAKEKDWINLAYSRLITLENTGAARAAPAPAPQADKAAAE